MSLFLLSGQRESILTDLAVKNGSQMKDPYELGYAEPPVLGAPWLPKDEQQSAYDISRQFSMLTHFLVGFGYALTLYDSCEEWRTEAINKKNRAREDGDPDGAAISAYMRESAQTLYWHGIAAREGALTISDFYQTMKNIERLLENCLSVGSLVNPMDLASCLGQFLEEFPEPKEVRNAACHQADLTYSTKTVMSNAFGGELHDGGMHISGGSKNLCSNVGVGRARYYSIHGKMLKLEITESTLQRLSATRDRFFSLFARADEAAKQRMYAQPIPPR
jgi:hypothetical protein